MSDSLNNLLNRNLLFITGKGGVGKSTVSLVMAKRAIQMGKRALVVAVNQQRYIQSFYGESAEPTYEPQEVEPGLSFSLIDSQQALHEYVIRQIKFEFLYRHAFENKAMKYFLDATPGLQDLLVLGKIVDLAEKIKRNGFDILIVDMPATGHGLNMLRIPFTVSKMIKSGPLHRRALHMHSFISNSVRTGIGVVTLAEEMPVNESIELIHTLRQDVGLSIQALIVNGVFPPLFKDSDITTMETLNSKSKTVQSCVDFARSRWIRRKNQDQQIASLHQESESVPKLELPFLFDAPFSLGSLNSLESELKILEGVHA